MSAQELLAGLSVVAGLVVLEGLLSVDNVLGIAALASELPRVQQRRAIRIGLALAYAFRVLALAAASWLAMNAWVRWLGAAYLIWLMSSHLTRGHAHDVAAAVEQQAGAEGTAETGQAGAESASAPLIPSPLAPAAGPALASVLLQIGLMDLSLSIDNVIAAVGLAPKNADGAPTMWPIYFGVFIAILALQAIAPHAMNLLRRFPILEPTAFVLIGYVGVLLIVEEAVHQITGTTIHVPPYAKFAGILFIIWTALLYAADGAVRRIVRPFVHAAMPVMHGVTRAVGVLLWPLTRLLEEVG
jgi:tellurite resistance protein TerC